MVESVEEHDKYFLQINESATHMLQELIKKSMKRSSSASRQNELKQHVAKHKKMSRELLLQPAASTSEVALQVPAAKSSEVIPRQIGKRRETLKPGLDLRSERTVLSIGKRHRN